MSEPQQYTDQDKLSAEVANLVAQTRRTDQLRFWYPAILLFGAAGAGAAVAAATIKIVGL